MTNSELNVCVSEHSGSSSLQGDCVAPWPRDYRVRVGPNLQFYGSGWCLSLGDPVPPCESNLSQGFILTHRS